MLKIYNNLSFKNKIILTTLLISFITTLTGITISYYNEIKEHKNTIKERTLIEAQLISQYCALPLELDFPSEAKAVLEKLKKIKHINNGVIYNSKNEIFAEYNSDNRSKNILSLDKMLNNSVIFEDDYLHILYPVTYKGNNYGHLYLKSKINIKEFVANKIPLLFILFAAMLFLSWGLANLLHRLISKPIIALTNFTENISNENNYHLRIVPQYNDETGKLFTAYNQMLDKIAERDRELSQTLEFLSESEKKYRELFEANKDGITIFYINNDNTVSDIIKTNEASSKMLGFSTEELLKLNVDNLEVEISKENRFNRIEELKKYGFSNFRTYLRHKEGYTIPVEISAIILQYDNKPAIMNIVRDITEKETIDDTYSFLLSNNNLRGDLDFFHHLAKYLAKTLAMDYVCIDRLIEGNFEAETLAIYYDGKWDENVKYTLKDTPCGDVVGNEVCLFPRNVRNLFPTDNILQEMKAEGYIGTTLWDTTGKAIGLIALISRKEINNPELAETVLKLVAVRAAAELERQDAENELRESEEKYRRLSENISDVVWILDVEKQKFVYVSPSVEKMRGYTPAEVMDMPLELAVANEDQKHLNELLRKRISDYYSGRITKNNFYTDEIQQTRKDGTVVWTEVVSTYYINEKNDRLEILGVSRDISERKQAEKAILESQRLGAIGEMSSAVAHDFNNSLQTIFGNLELALLNDAIPNQVRNYLEIIKTSASDAATRVQLLQRFGGKKHTLSTYSQINCNNLIDDVIIQSRPLWKGQSEKRGIEINVVTKYSDIPFIKGNEGELRAVMYNIIKNSIEAMPDGGVIAFATSSIDDDIEIRISDTGIGMEEETKKRIFQPFFTTKGFEIGRGLGMSGAYTIIQEHGGFINVNSEKFKGTTIEIKLPIVGKEEIENKEVREEAFYQQAKILWVDDDNMIKELALNIIEVLGHKGDSVSSGKDALEYLENNIYDLVVTDIGMPGMNGWELAEKIKEKYEGKIKVAVQTGWGDQIDDEMKKKYGIISVLGKPFKVEQVKNLINSIIQGNK